MASGRILEILQEGNALSKFGEQWIETYFQLLFEKVKHGGNKETFTFLLDRETGINVQLCFRQVIQRMSTGSL